MRPYLLMVVVAACRVAGADDPPPQRFEHDMMVRFHMHESFDLVRAAEKLLIRGKLDDAKLLARGLASAPDEPGFAPWASYAIDVRAKASAVTEAITVDDGCRAIAHVGEACAGCHVALAVAPEFRVSAFPPPDRATVDARMARHRWAADRLWEAVIGGDDDAWRTGLDVLAAAPIDFGPERKARAQTLQRQASEARLVDGLHDRASAYGELLVTCAGCHTAAPIPAL